MVLARNLPESTKIQHHAWATVLSPSKSNTMHGLYSTESIKIQHHAWAIQYWVHHNTTPCMGYTVLSPSKSNTMHGLYSTESIKIQHNQLFEFDGFGVVRVNIFGGYLLGPSLFSTTLSLWDSKWGSCLKFTGASQTVLLHCNLWWPVKDLDQIMNGVFAIRLTSIMHEVLAILMRWSTLGPWWLGEILYIIWDTFFIQKSIR